MNFIEAIQQGIEASNNYDKNMEEIKSIFNEVNKAVFSRTGKENSVFMSKDEICSSGYFDSIRFGSHAYPVEIRLHGNIYHCQDKIALVDMLHELISSASFGFYIKRMMED